MSDDSLSTKDVITLIGQIITWGIVVAGWTMVAKDNNHREQRKEVRAQLNELIKDIHACGKKGHKYAGLDVNDDAATLAAEIKYDLCNIGKTLNRLRSAGIVTATAAKQMVAFRQEITGGDFDQAGRQKSMGAMLHTKMLRISSVATDLIEQLEADFFAKYNTTAAKWSSLWRE